MNMIFSEYPTLREGKIRVADPVGVEPDPTLEKNGSDLIKHHYLIIKVNIIVILVLYYNFGQFKIARKVDFRVI